MSNSSKNTTSNDVAKQIYVLKVRRSPEGELCLELSHTPGLQRKRFQTWLEMVAYLEQKLGHP